LLTRTSGIEHEVVSLAGPDRYSAPIEALGVKVHHLGMDSIPRLFPGLFRLPGIVRQSRADVVQCWMYRANLLGGLAARRAGIPVVWNIRCSPGAPIGRGSYFLAWLTGRLAGQVPDFIINCSERSAEEHVRLGFASAPGAVVPNGYDPAEFIPDEDAREKTRESLGIFEDNFLIGSITRWTEYKDVPTLLRACRIAQERGVPVRCVLVGNALNAINPALMSAIRDIGGSPVLPLGKRRDIESLARAMDLHILSSTTEAFPNVVAETMLSGTSNTATDVGDAAKIIGDTGWIVPPRDAERLADAIEEAWREWKERPGDWQNRRESARRQITENFSLEKMIESYESIWATVSRR
jgi:glycosyltransferase involved in cell wall biosynthesis